MDDVDMCENHPERVAAGRTIDDVFLCSECAPKPEASEPDAHARNLRTIAATITNGLHARIRSEIGAAADYIEAAARLRAEAPPALALHDATEAYKYLRPPGATHIFGELPAGVADRWVKFLELRAEAPEPQCVWAEEEGGEWETSCGRVFELTTGTPTDNGLAFCAFCGKPLVESRYDLEAHEREYAEMHARADELSSPPHPHDSAVPRTPEPTEEP